jgi:hypothetical protein
LNILGDYRLSSSCNTLKWAIPPQVSARQQVNGMLTSWNEMDYSNSLVGYTPKGNPIVDVTTRTELDGNSFSGNQGSGCFAMATDLQTSNGIEISGLNAEEQSDISLLVNWSAPQASNCNLEVYTYYDAMIVLRENNVLYFLTLGIGNDSISFYVCVYNICLTTTA